MVFEDITSGPSELVSFVQHYFKRLCIQRIISGFCAGDLGDAGLDVNRTAVEDRTRLGSLGMDMAE